MDPSCIRHTELPGTSKLFADFSYHFDRVARFYRHNPFRPESYEAAAREVQYPEDRRAAMARALKAQNGDHPLLDRFRQPDTVAVVTGQQVGLFSGPAYTIYKALTAVKLAEQLTSRGTPAVPIFWLATEDHDFAEVSACWTFDGSHRPVKLEIAGDGKPRPVGGIAIAKPPLEGLRSALHGMLFADEVMEAVQETYLTRAPLGASFRALLVRLLGSIGILTLDPLDPAVRAIGAPFMADALSAAGDLRAALLHRGRELDEAGYHGQVLVDDKTSLFFSLERGERHPLRKKDTEFATLRDRAPEISPNALLRPVWQDFMLPTVAYVGGPGELAYFAQSQVIYDRLLGRMPVMLARAGFTLLDHRTEKLLHRYGLHLTDTLVLEDTLQARIAAKLIPAQLAQSYEKTASEFGQKLERLSAETEAFDGTLGPALVKSREKILYQLNKARRKVEREALRRDAQAAADAQYLTGTLYPHKHLQERFYSILPFLAQHGMDLPQRLFDLIELGCPDHRVA